MRKFTLKIFTFSLILIILFFLANPLFKNKKIYWHKSQEYQTEFSSSKNIDIAFFGSSHTLCSYDPRIVESELNYNAFNFGYANQRLVTAIPLMEHVVEKYNLNLAVVDIFQASLAQPPYNEKVKSFQLKTFDYLPNSLGKLKQMKDIYGLEGVLFKAPIFREHAQWYDKFFQETFQLDLNQDYYKGFYTKTVFDSKSWKKITSKAKTNNHPKLLDSIQISDKQKIMIENLVAYFQEKKVPLIFVNAPMFKGHESNEFYTYNALIKKYLKTLGVTYINLNEYYDDLGLSKKDYRDLSHLNSSGAIKVTKFLTDHIQKEFSISKKSDINYYHNRYYHIENNFEKGILYLKTKNKKKFKDKFEIESVGLYKMNEQFLELVFESPKKTKDLEISLSYKTGVNTDKYSIENSSIKLNKKNKYNNTSILKNGIDFKGKYYNVIRIPVPKGEIYDFTVFVKPLKMKKIKIIKENYLRL